MTCLPDVNVWISLAASGHVHHQIAKKWFDGCNEAIVFCRVTEMGLFRLLTNAKVMGEDVLAVRSAWRVRDSFFEDSRIVFATEPVDFERSWNHTANQGKIGPNFWTDGYLESIYQALDCTLVTFDGALSRRKRVKSLPLAASGH